MGLSWGHILVVLVVFVLLFGRGKISEMMGDVAKGIKSFKKGLADDEDAPRPAPLPPSELHAQEAPERKPVANT